MSGLQKELFAYSVTTPDGQKYMSPLDKYRLTHIFKLLGTRIIPVYFFNQNPKEFCKWQMNACRQTALIVAYFFDKLLQSFPHEPVKIQIWDGEFKDAFTPWYNHAWMTACPVSNSNTQVFIDVARISTYPIVNFRTRFLDPVNLSDGLGAMETELIKRNELDYFQMLNTAEYYTGKTGLEVCQDIEKLMLMYRYKLEEFEWEDK